MPMSPEQRRASNRASQARSRARQRAIRNNEAIPPAAVNRRHSAAVTRAYNTASAMRAARTERVESLPDIRNMKNNLFVGRDPMRGKGDGVLPYKATKSGQGRQAEALIENERAKNIRALGRSRQYQLATELNSGPNAERLQQNMDPEQQRRFQQLSEQIAAHSQQSLGLLFSYADGKGDYSGVLEAILASPESLDVELGLSRLALLAKRAKLANEVYSVKRVGAITV